MAPPTNDEEPKFRFRVKIMPPRRLANSLFKHIQQPTAEEPLHTIAVPARASETFADVWKNIKERYERNYTAEEVAKGWFHKLQDRYGADIDSHDGVGELGYTVDSPREDLVLIMLQNGLDRDGSVPETSGLRPAGFSKPELSAEQVQDANRRETQEERYGVALEDADEDTPIQSRERSLGPGTPEQSVQVNGDDHHKIDADGFAVPLLPGAVSRKRKRASNARPDIIPSSMEEENDEDVLIQRSQDVFNDEGTVRATPQKAAPASRKQAMHSMAVGTSAGASKSSTRAKRARTTALNADKGLKPLHTQILAAHQATSSQAVEKANGAKSQPQSPPTPVSTTSQPFIQQPPESAQRPKPTSSFTSTSAIHQRESQLAGERDRPEDSLDFDPIEDDDLLQGMADTVDDDNDHAEIANGLIRQAPVRNVPVSTKSTPGKLTKPNKTLSFTPRARSSTSKNLAFTPTSTSQEHLSGTQGSTSKNPRSQSGIKELWTSEEDGYLIQGIREGLGAAETAKKFNIEGRTPSAVRGRRALLIKRNPGIDKVYREGTADRERSGQSATKRRAWSMEEKQIMSRAIADGFDALEIHAKHFPGRSEDSVNRAVLSLQDQAWKVASMDIMFPKNGAQLPGWTPKDSCKLKRTYIENLETSVARRSYFGRWTMQQVQKQLDAYSAQIKSIKTDQARASQADSAIKTAAYGISQLPFDSSQLLVNSSPVERSLQARAARRPSIDTQQPTLAIDVTSSPPHAAADRSSMQMQRNHQSSNQERKSSSPTVEISATEQETARGKVVEKEDSQRPVTRPTSGSGIQSTLNFIRDKGKKRAGDPWPTSEELHARSVRHRASSSSDRLATQLEPGLITTRSHKEGQLRENEDSYDEQNLTDDLEMLDAGIERRSLSPEASRLGRDPFACKKPPVSGNKTDPDNSTTQQIAHQAPLFSDGRRQSTSTAMTMQSPMTTSSTSSGQRRRSRVESGVDNRVAVQLTQELNRSLSGEERERREEAAHEDQVFSTPDPKINRYHRTPKHSAVTISADAATKNDTEATEERQNIQTQDPVTARFQHDARASTQTKQSPSGTDPDPYITRKAPSLQPSPKIGSSESSGRNAVISVSSPVKPGKLPSRGQSYASRIKDIHRQAQSAQAVTNVEGKESPVKHGVDDTTEPALDEKSSLPTDDEIWEKAAIAKSLGRDRREYFEDLKISTHAIRALGCGDWDEVNRLKAQGRRLHRERKIARGDHIPSHRDTQHLDGPAQSGDGEQADEDVVRADDVSDASSQDGEYCEEKVWSDVDCENSPDMDHNRHFSEVENDELLAKANKQTAKATEGPEDVNHSEHVIEVDKEKTTEPAQELPRGNNTNVPNAHSEYADEPDLPTVKILQKTNGNTQHALTDENLQELNNSGADDSPTRILTHKRKVDSSTNMKRDNHQSNDQAAMPPPVGTKSRASKRKGRRQRLSNQRTSKSGSERSSSFSHPHPSSDAPQRHAPSTPIRSEPTAHQSERVRPIGATTAEQTPNPSGIHPQPSTVETRNVPASSMRESRRVDGGGISGLSGLVRKAHIPTPPKAKRASQTENKVKRLDIRASDDESDESSDSD